ncbi:MAG TPA: hypothetical protein VM141_03450 [Planctomycetota bacterium]|nr:hypothetical protein [Planctomycetota bacterium]
MKLLAALIVAVLQALLPWLARKSRSTAEDGDPDKKTRNKLRKKVREFWLIVVFLVFMPATAGCVRTVYVPAGTPVRLRETLKNVKVWVKDADGEVVAGKMDLPEGWYALSVDTEEE